jgi:hypothetical protein
MSKRKQIESQDKRPVRSSVSDEFLTWADGSFITHEHYSDYTQAAHDEALAMSPEEVYVASLMAGLSRDPRIESEIDMAEVKRLLAAEDRVLPDTRKP